MILRDEVYAIQVNEGADLFIVYAPLHRVLFLANGAAVNEIGKILKGNGLENCANPSIRKIVTENQLLEEPSFVPRKIKPVAFAPTKVILALTYGCNLRCVYCYADGGSRRETLPLEVATAAIDLVAKNAANLKKKRLPVTFHGAGEALVNWPLFRKCVEYAEKTAKRYGLAPMFSLVTNGTLLSKDRVEFLKQRRFSLTLSIDGPKDIQNSQRPSVAGNSYHQVMRGVQNLRDMEVPFSVRATATKSSCGRLEEIVTFFAKEVLSPHGRVHVEPATEFGRAEDDKDSIVPEARSFIENYRKAKKVANALGVKLTCSAESIEKVSANFCGANGRIFFVLPTGYVSGCTRACDLSSPISSTFIYGKFDAETRTFVIDEERFFGLSDLSLENLPECGHCFCKWQCAGQCPSKRLVSKDGAKYMCKITRNLLKSRLLEILEDAGKEVTKC